jgi:integrase
MLPPVREALEYLFKNRGNDKYVFRDEHGKLLTPDHVREVIWKPVFSKPALIEAGLHYRPMIQTRHSFATMMIEAGEELGWIQNMMGHSTLQMIFTRYHAWIKKPSRNDGSAFMSIFQKTQKVEDIAA